MMHVIQIVAVLGVVIRALHACSVVLITDTMYRHDASGLYGQISQICSDKPVFKQKGGLSYLSFINDADFTGWMVTTRPCINRGSLAVASTASHPTQVTSTWEEYDSVQEHVFDFDDWKYNANLKVTCYTTFKGCRDVVISGTRYTADIEGTYSWQGVDDICHGKFVYRHFSYSYYLYSYGGSWAVGPTRCAESGYVHVFDDAFYPEDVSASWKELMYGLSFWITTDMELDCKVRRASTPVTIRTTTAFGRTSRTTTASSWTTRGSRRTSRTTPASSWTTRGSRRTSGTTTASASAAGGGGGVFIIIVCCCCIRRKRRGRSDRGTRVGMMVVSTVQMDRSTSGAANDMTRDQKQSDHVVPPTYPADQPALPPYDPTYPADQPAPPPYYHPPNPVVGDPTQPAPMPYAPQSPNGYPA